MIDLSYNTFWENICFFFFFEFCGTWAGNWTITTDICVTKVFPLVDDCRDVLAKFWARFYVIEKWFITTMGRIECQASLINWILTFVTLTPDYGDQSLVLNMKVKLIFIKLYLTKKRFCWKLWENEFPFKIFTNQFFTFIGFH